MKKIFFAIIFSIIFSASVSANTYIENIFNWKKMRVFEYDIKNENYIFKVAVNPDYNATSLKKLMEENNGISAINWVFLCPKDYKECGKMDFTKNERYVAWEKFFNEFSTGNRVVFAWDKQNNPFLFQSGKINPDREKDIFYGFANHPLILQDWVDKVPEYADLWLVDTGMKRKWTRNFICSTEKKDKIYVWFVYDISVPDLPEYLKKFGCFDALNLDAWATSSMIYNWRQIVWPGRNLLDWVIIERKSLDTKVLREKTKVVRENLKKILENKTPNEKIEIIEKFNKAISNYRNGIYDRNSFKFYDENAKQTWYKIVLEDLKTLENIYLLNYVSTVLNEFLNEAKKEKKYLEDSEWLLF